MDPAHRSAKPTTGARSGPGPVPLSHSDTRARTVLTLPNRNS